MSKYSYNEKKKSFIITVILIAVTLACLITVLISYKVNKNELFESQDFARAIASALGKKTNELDEESLSRIEVLYFSKDSQTGLPIVSLGYDTLYYYLSLDTESDEYNDKEVTDGVNNNTYSAYMAYSFNAVNDLKLFKGLKFLYLQGFSSVKTLDFIDSMPNIEMLSIGSTSIDDISILSGRTSIKTLDISNLDLTDISVVSTLTNIDGLSIDKNPISDISHLNTLTNLKTLSFSECGVKEINFIEKLENLTSINFSSNEITDISPLKQLSSLKSIYASDNKIIDITALDGLKKVNTLIMNDNEIVDISSLASMINLEYLTLSNNKIVDVTPISELTKMKYLYLDNNEISDISELKHYDKNSFVLCNLTGNKIPDDGWEVFDKYSSTYIYGRPSK